jgi:hypothetical protein
MRSSISAQSWASVPPEPGLDVEIAVGGVGLALKHAPELQPLEALFQRVEFALDVVEGRPIAVGGSQLRQLVDVGERAAEARHALDHIVERGALLVQRLGAILVVPDLGVGELELDLFEALALPS